MKQRKWIAIGIGVLALATLVIGISAFSFISPVSASIGAMKSAKEAADFGPSRPGGPEGPRESPKFLAQALNITEEELQAAQAAAYKAAVEEALQKGLITQAQADRLEGMDSPMRHGLSELLVGPDSGIDMEVFLADALAITAEDLQAAREQAFNDAIAARVENGDITEEQAGLIKANQALRDYLDPTSLMADALGITAEQLESYRAQHLRPDEIAEELGITSDEMNTAMQSAYKKAVTQAVEDGVITQEQADLILENQDNGLPFGPHGRGGFDGGPGKMGPGMHGGFEDPGQLPKPATPQEGSNF